MVSDIVMPTQQEQALAYFRRAAREWRESAEGGRPQTVNIIKQRNDYVLSVARQRSTLISTLDVGCGTGELVCDLARLRAQAVGVDFAEEMVALSTAKAAGEGLEGCEFVATSVFDYEPETKFDLISANGFIEYISPVQLIEFLRRIKRWLAPGGSFVLGSRNRLFNLFSLNRDTRMELDRGGVDRMLEEAVAIAESASEQDCATRLSEICQVLLPFDDHPKTGIDVATRHQYTPAQVLRLLRDEGFDSIGLYPIHYHGFLPRFGQEHPALHAVVAETTQECGSHYLIPFSSSFMIHAKPAGEK
jgi:2-polyprenyl-3-methyl-5-hydroxy-6-metoxy-1,4-benzoquinol methylase